MAKVSFIEENDVQKFAILLRHPTLLLLLLFVHCARSSFHLDLIAGYHEIMMLT